MCEKQIHPLNCSVCGEEHIKTKCPLHLAGQQGILSPAECLLMNTLISKIGCATCEIQPLDILERFMKRYDCGGMDVSEFVGTETEDYTQIDIWLGFMKKLRADPLAIVERGCKEGWLP